MKVQTIQQTSSLAEYVRVFFFFVYISREYFVLKQYID